MPAEQDQLHVELDEAVRLLVEAFTSKSVDYALVGGLAASLRGRPRFTQDVDLLVQVSQVALPSLLDELIGRGFDLDAPRVIREYVQEHLTAFRYKTVRIDWLKPMLPLYANTLAGASLLPWKSGQPIRVARPEGLILTKLAAFRPQDQLDIEMLLSSNRDDLDLDLIRTEWSAVAEVEDARTAWLEGAIARNLQRESRKDSPA
jgi:hypothetical protein